MEACCIEPQWPENELLMKYQYVSDFLIALAYFSIPLELIYFVKKSAVFPYKWVLMEFGAFIILCGATHFISLWTFSIHSRTVAAVMAVSKMCTALVSCVTALTLIHIIPDLLSVKTRELYLKNKSAELERQMGVMRTQNELARHVRMLTQEIRSTLDRDTILNRTLVELARTLALEECTLWMPTRSGLELQLSHSLMHGQNTSSLPFTVPICHPSIKHVFSSNQALEISSDSPVVFIQSHRGRHIHGDVAAVLVPLLYLSDFHINDSSEPSTRSYALMVLTLPYDSTRRWHDHELELVNAVADQVAVALSHSTALEESWRAQRLLMEQNLELAMARQKAETAIHTRTDFLALMNHEMQMLMYAIVALSLLFPKTKLSPEQRFMVNTILNSSHLLDTLIRDILALSMLEDGSLPLEMRTFSIPLLFHKILKSIQPVASVKKLSFSMSLSRDLPEYAVGDDKRLMQIALNLVGNALKFTRQGSIHVTVCLERPEFLRDKLSPESNLVYDDNHFYMRVQVTDTGQGIHPQDIPNLFTKLVHSDSETTRSHEVTGLGLTISKRFVKLMSGHVWIESEGFGKGSTVIFIVKLGFLNKGNYLEQSVANSIQFNQQHMDLSGLKVVLVLENNGVDSMFTMGLLIHLGCDVTVVNSGQECLQVISRPMQNIKVIFLDLCTPESDCYAVAVDVQKVFPTKHERPLLVALIANTDRTTIEKQMTLGMDGVLLKPISLEKIQNILAELLKGCCLCETIERR